jgi:phage-related protein
MTLPISHLEDSVKLEADALVSLWEIQLANSPARIYLRYGPTVTWQSKTFSGSVIVMSGEGDYSGEEVARPTLTFRNPDGAFSNFAATGALERSIVVRYEVLQAHLLANLNIYQRRIWMLSRPTVLTKEQIQVELRGLTDIPNFEVPVRMFMPPEFPFVSV